MKYKGAVVKNSEGLTFVFIDNKEKNIITDGFPILDPEGYYIDLELYQIYLTYVNFADGTLPVTVDYASEKNFEDIYISMEDLQIVSLSSDGGKTETPIHEIIENGDFASILREFFDDDSIYYEK